MSIVFAGVFERHPAAKVVIGEGIMMWGPDFLRPDGVWPDSRRSVEREPGPLPEATRREIICDNAGGLYRFID